MYYGRDRGEDNCEPSVTASERKFFNADGWMDYFYLFKDGKWIFARSEQAPSTLTPLDCEKSD